MRIQECEFADDAWYDEDGLVWARPDGDEVVVGVTAILAAMAGKLTSVRGKPTGVQYARGEGVGAVESGRYFGIVRTPITGTLLAVNPAVLERPKLLSESPYAEGWFARLRPRDWGQQSSSLFRGDAAKDRLAAQIAALHVRCFAAFPDYEMYEIGVECAAVLVQLNERVDQMEVGEIVHVVSDDWTAPAEMAQWSDQTGHPIVETRREGNLYHFLVRKAR